MTNTYHAAHWSDLSYSLSEEDEFHYRITHHNRIKQRGNQEQRVLDSRTWEEILAERDPGHRLGNIAAPRQSWRQLKLSGGDMMRQHGSATGTRGGAHGECGRVRLET